MQSELKIYTDGGSRGNPGEAAYGFAIYDTAGKILHEEGKKIGITTNNVAEYSAILAAFKWVEHQPFFNEDKISNINFLMDSKLACEQLSGHWKIKNENLRGLYFAIKELEEKFAVPISYTHVRREYNREADKMVNLALDDKI